MARLFRTLSVALLLSAAVPSAMAQQTLAPLPDLEPKTAAGWTFTPSLALSESWDDNILVRGQGDRTERGFLSLVSPGANLNFDGGHGQFFLGYDGAYRVYQGLTGLDSYEQRASLSARRLLTPRFSVFFRDSAGIFPSTEFTQLAGVPFVRTGSRHNDAEAGMDAQLTKRTSLAFTATYQVIDFDGAHTVNELLRDGESLGGQLALRRQIGAHTTLSTDYSLQHATIGPTHDIFNIHSATVGVDHQLSNSITIFTSAGASYLGKSVAGPARSGPRVRLGLIRQTGRVGLELGYSHAYVPSYTLVGTTRSDGVSTRLRYSFTRRVYAQSAVSWMRTEPVFELSSRLTTVWADATVGVAVRPWLRLETFFEGVHQSTGQPGGVVARNRIGIQIVTTRPMRID